MAPYSDEPIACCSKQNGEDIISAEEIEQLMLTGKKFYANKEISLASEQFEEACAKSAEKYGQTADECGEAYFYYGKSLLDIARTESDVLGNAVPKEATANGAEDEEGDEEVEEEEEESKEDKKEDKDREEKETKEEQSKDKEDEEMGSAENQEEECNEEDSAEEGEENEGDSDSKDDVTNMQLAWEMLELSRIIFARQDTKEMKMKQAEANLALGEIGMELEHYPEAIGDFMECLRLQEQILQPDDRLLAETFYNLGLAYSFDRHYGKAIEYYNKAITVIKLRINNLKEQMKEKDDTNATELNDLEELIPDIAAKVEDAEYMKRTTEDIIKTAANIAKESLGESSVFGAPISAFDASASAFDVPNSAFDAPASGFDAPNSAFDAPVSGFDAPNSGFDAPVSTENTKEPDVKVTNICHLVRKKRKTDDESGGSKKARPNEDQGKEE